MRVPDFIIIGAMKCATSTLHEQLARQPDILMSTPKEPNFFSDDAEYARGIQWYASLFESAPHEGICGESSTHYTKLPTHPHTVERMARHLPEGTRFIYVMRHPIDRLISQYIHEWTQRVIDEPIDQAIAAHPELIAYSRYAMQLQPYFDAFGRERVLPVFFEQLSARPQAALERVCRFIGYLTQPVWDASLPEQNVSTERLRTSPLRDAIVEFAPLRAIRRRFIPKGVRDRVKRMWTMTERPELSASNLERLTAIFDEDLALLGSWLGLELRCDNFSAAARAAAPAWRASAKVSAA